ncbi:T9SS type A sorting domain-containing protein [Psychroserpens sp.]|uniref:T9SS type A sorting domain-containing protein n=1 Tax=Psychroserpens sp. TaxID=2020870 RepID=UPI002B275564|nr:T9SS type A sorting domain-containing protein [Psychroserpens sp.]
MKNYYLVIVLLLSVSVFAQDKNNPLLKFDTSQMETTVLVHKSPIVDIQKYNETTSNRFVFYQAYKAIAQGDFEKRLLPLQSLKTLSKQSYFTNVIPLAILHSEYDVITDEAMQNNSVSKDAQGYLVNDGSFVFEKQQLTVASALRSKHKGLQTTYNLASSSIFNISNASIITVEIDFDDGNNFRTMNLNENLTVTYLEAGLKVIRFKIVLNTGEVILRNSTIDITYSNSDIYSRSSDIITTFTSSITPDLSVYSEPTSYPGTGEYELFLSADNILDKPIFLVDGFDPDDGRSIAGIYDLLNFDNGSTTSNLGDIVRAEGFDIVILNFPIYVRTQDGAVIDGGADFIERNAMLLVDLINTINSDKVGNEQNVVIGPSMGGLISRYALSYMESQNMVHDTRLWISFDAPHQGANVPIGFQHQFNFLAFGLDDFWILGDQNVEELQPIIDGMLKSPAARQMLTDQFESHITNSDGVTFNGTLALPQPNYFKSLFDSRINSFTPSGFPELTRNVSIINGSGMNNRYQNNANPVSDLLPGNQILDADINIMTGADLKVETYFTPNAGTQIETSKVHLDFAWWFPLANDRINNASAASYTYSNGIDAGSGGLFDILGLTTDLATDGLVGEFLGSLSTDYFNFIPSVSAMALEPINNQINWFDTLASVTTNDTPFVSWYMPDDNEPHVTLTDANVAFALNEIIPETLSMSAFENENIIQIESNPVVNELVILSGTPINDVFIEMYDVTGKIVYKNNFNSLSNRTVISLDLDSGLYVLNMAAKDHLNYKTKIVVK